MCYNVHIHVPSLLSGPFGGWGDSETAVLVTGVTSEEVEVVEGRVGVVSLGEADITDPMVEETATGSMATSCPAEVTGVSSISLRPVGVAMEERGWAVTVDLLSLNILSLPSTHGPLSPHSSPPHLLTHHPLTSSPSTPHLPWTLPESLLPPLGLGEGWASPW